MNSAPFQILLLAVVAAYCLMIYNFRGQMAACLKNIAGFKPEETPDVENKHTYDRFLRRAMILAFVVAGIGIVRIVASGVAGYGGYSVAESGLPQWVILALPVLAAAIVAIISLFKFGILKVAGALTLSRDFAEALQGVKRVHLAAMAILLTPCVLVFSGENPVRDIAASGLAGIVILGLAISLTVQSAVLFRKQKVSFLVWFLYLCAVEIFPAGFALLLAIKNA